MSSKYQKIKLVDRYPFIEEEIEHLTRCHALLLRLDDDGTATTQDPYLTKIALSSPYSRYFLPGNETRRRMEFIEGNILPCGFGSSLRAAMSVDLFVDCANEGQDMALERFLEGVANCGRRGHREALRVIWDCCSDGIEEELDPELIIDLCYRLGLATEFLSSTEANNEIFLQKIYSKHDRACLPLVNSLSQISTIKDKSSRVTKDNFMDWAETVAPQISSTLSSFVYSLFFFSPQEKDWNRHHHHRFNFSDYFPELDQQSAIFDGINSPILFSLACTSPLLGGKWHNLYSFEFHGNSMNRLQYSILGYSGPTLIVAETDQGHLLGGLTTSTWKKSTEFYGDGDTFVFQLFPTLSVFHATKSQKNYVWLCNGLGFGGTKDMPRLYIPESMESCHAGFLDDTFREGDLLPKDALEKFSIKSLEVWGVGGEEAIARGLKSRREKRDLMDSAICRARMIPDKKLLVQDFKLFGSKLYKHREDARGRAEFKVDDKHGGYFLEREQ